MTQAAAAPAICQALVAAGDRFDGLLHAVLDPAARAVGYWSAAETAAHVATVSYFDALSCGCPVEPPFEADELIERARHASVADVAHINELALDLFNERDLVRVAAHVGDNVTRVASAAADQPDATVEWLGGLPLTRGAVAGHLLGELVIHGHDIARSQSMGWKIDEGEARLVFDECYLPLLDAAGDRMAPPQGSKPVSVEFRVAGADPTVIDIAADRFLMHPPDARGSDVVLTADASTTLLTMFERVSPVGALLRRRLRVGGSRPWRILRMRRALSMP